MASQISMKRKPRMVNCARLKVECSPAALAGRLAPKSKLHIRGILSILWDYAIWQ